MHRRLLVPLFAAITLILLAVGTASAEDYPAGDERINQYHHFGGDAIYCVDSAYVATTDYATMLNGGGIRVLNMHGQELMFIPAADILAAIETAKATGQGTLSSADSSTYGPATLYVYMSGEIPHFVFAAFDEHGKQNVIDWTFCLPVLPIPHDYRDATDPICSWRWVYPQRQGKLMSFGTPMSPRLGGPPPHDPIPCSECPGEVDGNTCYVKLEV